MANAAAFMALEQISDFSSRSGGQELTQEDYEKLRESIESDVRIDELTDEYKEVLRNRYSPETNDEFEEALAEHARKRISFTRPEVISDLKNKFGVGRGADPDKFHSQFNPREPAAPEKTLRKLEDYLAGYYATWIIDIGLKSNLLQTIASYQNGVSLNELSNRLSLNPFYVSVWCKAAYGVELLAMGNAGYKLAPDMAEYLVNQDNPLNMSFDFAFSTALHEDFVAFPTRLATGERWPLADRPEVLQALYTDATLDDYPVITDVILPRMAPDMIKRLSAPESGQPFHILDVGTGAGWALVHYAKRFPQATITGIDINPGRVTQAQSAISNITPSGNVQVRQEDVKSLDESEQYDLIVFNLTVYEIRKENYPEVLRRVYEALKPEGVLLIADYHFPELEAAPTYRFSGYQILLGQLLHSALIGASIVSSEEIISIIKDNGFIMLPEEEGEDGPQGKVHHPIEERIIIVAKKGPSKGQLA